MDVLTLNNQKRSPSNSKSNFFMQLCPFFDINFHKKSSIFRQELAKKKQNKQTPPPLH